MRAQAVLAMLNRLPIGTRTVWVGPDRLYADSLDRVAAALAWKMGWLEAAERRLIARTVQPGMVAIDVGANIGVHTLHLARRVGSAGRVHALEPDPRNFRLLTRAVATAGLGQVTLHEAAAAARSGTATLYVSAAHHGDHRLVPAGEARETRPVRTVSLDELLADERRVDFVKIDVQGTEVDVLRGAAATLARSPGVHVLCEFTPVWQSRAGSRPEDFFAPLRAAGLVPHRVLADGGCRALDEGSAWRTAEARGFVNLCFRAPA
jgi:FkbM family methyltransferase